MPREAVVAPSLGVPKDGLDRNWIHLGWGKVSVPMAAVGLGGF